MMADNAANAQPSSSNSLPVVILGAGYSGIATAHQLLKYTLPVLPSLKVILVSPSTHHLWNLAVVRGIIPGEFDDRDLFREIEPGFNQYGVDAFEFVIGPATAIDHTRDVVQITTADHASTQDACHKEIKYSQLIVATGSSYPRNHLVLPFTNIGSHAETVEAFHGLQQQVEAASSIIVAGSGPTGVETTGELAEKFGRTKDVSLIVEGNQPLPSLLPQVSKAAVTELQSLGVHIISKTRVQDSKVAFSGKTIVTLSSGDTIKADLFLPLYGMRPNTAFVPSQFLDSQGSIKIDQRLRFVGQVNMWAVGDAGDFESKQLLSAERQAIHLHGNLHATLLRKGSQALKDLKPAYSPQIFFTLGKKKGTGQFLSWRVPSFVVTTSKAKTLFSDKGDGLIRGDNICRSSI